MNWNINNYDDFKKITKNIINLNFYLDANYKADLEKEYLIPNHIRKISVSYMIPSNIIFNKELESLHICRLKNKPKNINFPPSLKKLILQDIKDGDIDFKDIPQNLELLVINDIRYDYFLNSFSTLKKENELLKNQVVGLEAKYDAISKMVEKITKNEETNICQFDL
jgi:hypothetical protein